MKARKNVVAMLAAAFAAAALSDGALSDAEEKEKILNFVMLPSRLCGRATIDFRRELSERKLTNRAWFDGDTNRLARLICELAQTNNANVASMMMDSLGEYGTAEQLPFLYSCATNPAVGDKAVKAVLRIEGVTSNSLQVIQTYLTITNEFSRSKQHDRSLVCEELLRKVFESQECLQFRPLCVAMALDFAQNVNTMHVSIDDALVAVDPTYRYSKRRLAVMRTAQGRCVNPGLYNYVTNAINELVAYPEASLPD